MAEPVLNDELLFVDHWPVDVERGIVTMARTVTVPQQVYPAGTVEQTIDFFPANISRVRASFTRVSWPGTTSDVVMTVTYAWSSGGGGRATFPGGTVLNKQGQPATASIIEFDVPEDATGKRSVVSGTFTVQVHQPLTTAITLEAI